MTIGFHQQAFEDYQAWAKSDRKIFARINGLIKEIIRTPFTGTGRPEPLKHQLAGCWSRRITAEHRLVYQVTDQSVMIVSCRFHY